MKMMLKRRDPQKQKGEGSFKHPGILPEAGLVITHPYCFESSTSAGLGAYSPVKAAKRSAYARDYLTGINMSLIYTSRTNG